MTSQAARCIMARMGHDTATPARALADAICSRWSGAEVIRSDQVGRGWWWRPRPAAWPETVARAAAVRRELEELPRGEGVGLVFEADGAPCRVKVGAERGGRGDRAGFGSRRDEPVESFTAVVVRIDPADDREPSVYVVVPLEDV